MPKRVKTRSIREVDKNKKRTLMKLAKIGKILGYGGAAAFFLYGIYWLTIPRGAILAVGMFIAGSIIAYETHRVIKTG